MNLVDLYRWFFQMGMNYLKLRNNLDTFKNWEFFKPIVTLLQRNHWTLGAKLDQNEEINYWCKKFGTIWKKWPIPRGRIRNNPVNIPVWQKKMRIIKEKWRKETEHDVNHRGIRRHHGDRGGNQGHQASDYRLPALRGSVAPLLHHPQPPKQQNVVLKNTWTKKNGFDIFHFPFSSSAATRTPFPFYFFFNFKFCSVARHRLRPNKKKLGNPIKDNGGSESSRARARREEVEVEERPTQKKKGNKKRWGTRRKCRRGSSSWTLPPVHMASRSRTHFHYGSSFHVFWWVLLRFFFVIARNPLLTAAIWVLLDLNRIRVVF